MSELFLRTLRDDPADAEVPSHKLLIRAGYIRPIAPGLYSWLPLGLRVLRRIESIVREEMVAIGGQEILFPALLPRAPYEATNRWTEYGDGVFRLKDRRDNDYLLVVTCADMESYNAFCRRVLANDHDIRRFRTSFNLDRIKYDTRIAMA